MSAHWSKANAALRCMFGFIFLGVAIMPGWSYAEIPPRSLVIFSESMRRVVVSEEGSVQECERVLVGGVSVQGADATQDGKVVVAYTLDPLDVGYDSVVELHGHDCVPERQVRLQGWEVSGVAVNNEGAVWVSNKATQDLIRIDLATGDVDETLSMSGDYALQAITSKGLFVLKRSVPAEIRLLSRTGRVLRDLSMEGNVVGAVRMDPSGNIWVLHDPGVTRMTLRGQLLATFAVQAVGAGLAVTSDDTLWLGSQTGPGDVVAFEVSQAGDFLGDVSIPNATSPISAMAFVPRLAQGSGGAGSGGCNIADDGQSGAMQLLLLGLLAGLVARMVARVSSP